MGGEGLVFKSNIEIGGTTWGMVVWPNGFDDASDGYISVGLRRCNNPTCLQTSPVEVSGALELLDSTGAPWRTHLVGQSKFLNSDCRVCADFISKGDLLDPANRVAIDDVVVFRVTVSQHTLVRSEQPAVPAHASNACRLVVDLGALYSSAKYSDAILEAQDVRIPVHRSMLSARSPVFDRMFDAEMAEKATGIVKITDLTPEVVRALCEYMYTGKVEGDAFWSDDASTQELLEAALKYEVRGLVKECANKATCRITLENACVWLLWAARLDVDVLKQRCLDYVASHMDDVQDTDGWKQFTEDTRLFGLLGPELFRRARPSAKKAKKS